jgi:hypothetical protein
MAASKYDLILEDIQKVAHSNCKLPSQLTYTEYSATAKYSAKELQKFGGFHAIITDTFLVEDDQPELSVVQGQRNRKSYLKKLQKRVGDKEYFTGRMLDAMREVMAANPLPVSKTSAPTKFKISGKRRENVAFISDTHFGLDIDGDEVPGNEYNWKVSARRMAKYAEQVATYKYEHRKDCPTLRVCLGGDLAQGVIHLSEHGTQLMSNQIWGTTHNLFQMIQYWRKFYSQVVVECTPDNHLRRVYKGPDRATAQKYDSHATDIHLMLQAAFRTDKSVSFHIPKTPYTTFDVLGHRVFLTHGDTVLRSGVISKSVNIGRITTDVRALQAATDKHIAAVLLGHVHVPLSTTLDNGTELVINGTGSGTDSFAQSLGIMNNNPCQVVFEATEDYVVGDFRKVFLKDADTNMAYDKLIKPYDGSFKGLPG